MFNGIGVGDDADGVSNGDVRIQMLAIRETTSVLNHITKIRTLRDLFDPNSR